MASKMTCLENRPKARPKRPETLPRCPQDAPKTFPGRLKTDFGSLLGAQLGAMLATFSAQDGPRGSRTPLKGFLEDVLGRLGVVLGHLGGQEPTRASLGALFGLILEGFGRFLEGF